MLFVLYYIYKWLFINVIYVKKFVMIKHNL